MIILFTRLERRAWRCLYADETGGPDHEGGNRPDFQTNLLKISLAYEL